MREKLILSEDWMFGGMKVWQINNSNNSETPQTQQIDKNLSTIQPFNPSTNKSHTSIHPYLHTSKLAFTLAEVLITLGIIGVVSAMTLPTLIQNYQKHTTVNRLKQTYSLVYQAVKLSENDNDSIIHWQNINDITPEVWVNKYIEPYLKYTKKEISSTGAVYLYLSNGTKLTFSPDGNLVFLGVYLNPNAETNNFRNFFRFYIGLPETQNSCKYHVYCYNGSKIEVFPYDYVDAVITNQKPIRDYVKDAQTYGCNTTARGVACSALIMLDGWRIEKDYPW